ncbi:MAG: mucoidy inhibitor MuiA family protein [Calditrichaeota bacterium]|nr:MAG: mucoidy inhibitor MuiA family protein [Calditrichota bacterium]
MLRRRGLWIVFVGLWVALLNAEDVRPLDSKVVKATVFQSRALVTREATLSVTSGKHQLVFPDLPGELVDESVRVRGRGTARAKILDVAIEPVFTPEVNQQKVRHLQARRDSLKDEDQTLADQIHVLESQKEFLESIKAESPREMNRQMLVKTPSAEELQALVQFLGQNLTDIYTQLRALKRQRKRLSKKIEAVTQALRRIRNGESERLKKLVVTIAVERPGQLTLQAIYALTHASWYPVYDIRVLPREKKVEVIYQGMVQQNTGEDWNDIQLTLSTAQPALSTELPELSPVYLTKAGASLPRKPSFSGRKGTIRVHYYVSATLPVGVGAIQGRVFDRQTGEPLPGCEVSIPGTRLQASTDIDGNYRIDSVPAGRHLVEFSFIGYQGTQVEVLVKGKNLLWLEVGLYPAAIEGEKIVLTAEAPEEAPIEQETSRVRTIPISTAFDIPSRSTIPADDVPHKVTIAIQQFDVEFEYLAVPKVMEKVFMKAKTVNRSLYLFLPGEANVFLGSDFVNRVYMPLTVSNDTLAFPVGIDDEIQVRRTLLRRFEAKKGFGKKKRQITYEYEILLTNNKATEQTIQVVDQVPISRTDAIKVKLLEPQSDQVRMDKLRRLYWNVSLKPGESHKLRLAYQVEFPASMTVAGLE